METEESVVREFVRAFNDGEIDAFARTLDPKVELESMKGVRRGIAEARKWATRSPGGVQQTVVIESLKALDETVLLLIRRDWHWAEDEGFAGSDEMAWLFRLSGGLVRLWRPFDDREQAEEVFQGS